MGPLGTRLRRALADDRIVVWAIAWVLLLTCHLVFEGFTADDHALRGLTLRLPPWNQWSKSPLELFSFYDGTPARTMSLVDHGFSPWWSDPHLRIKLFRPLASLTHWIDFHGGPPALAHVQTLLWYVGVVAAVGALYRRVLGATWVAGFAIVIFAVDHNHGPLIEWTANRNALVAGLFGVLALVAHDRARHEGRTGIELLSALCFALGLGGGEGALGVAGYLAAYAIFLDDRGTRARLASLLPHLAVLAAWVAVYKLGHFGAHGSGVYIDPAADPGDFLVGAMTGIPLLLQTELGGLAPDVMLFVPQWRNRAALIALGFIAVAFTAFMPLLRDRRARFFLCGALLALVPVAATFPSGRLLLLPSIGLLGLVAMVVEGMLDRTVVWQRGPSRWAALFTAVWIGGGHFFFSPLALQVTSRQLMLLERVLEGYSEGLGDDPRLARQRVVVVNPPDVFFAYYTVALRLTSGRITPAKMLSLASGKRPLEVERTDADTLVVRQESGFFREGTELLTRSPHDAMPAGSRVVLDGVTIDVTRAGADGVPTEAAFHFAGGLENEALAWFAWRGKTFVPFDLPRVGEKRTIEAQQPSL